MFNKKLGVKVLVCALFAAPAVSTAGVSPDLPYPTGDVTADQIVDQVYFVNHFYALKNFAITKKGRDITVLVSKAQGKKPSTNTLERYLNNNYGDDATVRAKDLAIFRSGKLKGTGMLITDYDDDAKSQSYMIWLPALRKIRRFAQPAHDDAWGGTDFTFGDVVLRKPHNETHELLGKATLKVVWVPWISPQISVHAIPRVSQRRLVLRRAKRCIRLRAQPSLRAGGTTVVSATSIPRRLPITAPSISKVESRSRFWIVIGRA